MAVPTLPAIPRTVPKELPRRSGNPCRKAWAFAIPCVRCNSFTKFRDLLSHADALDCAYLATGHYVTARDGALFRGRDPQKDQSYFLWGIDRAVLSRMLLPVGDLDKAQTRARAHTMGLEVIAEKPESQEICFVPDGDYARILEQRLPADAPALSARHTRRRPGRETRHEPASCWLPSVESFELRGAFLQLVRRKCK